MQLSRSRRRRIINLTPLIDVVFLLLVFFMLASTFLKFGSVKLETAGGGNQGAVDTSKLALIHVGAGNTFLVSGLSVQPDELTEALEKLRTSGKTDAVIVLRKEATAADLISGLARIRQHGFSSVRVVD